MGRRSVQGKRVLITGAGGGFGSAITEALRARGAHVVGLDQVIADGVIQCDITDDSAVAAAVSDAVSSLGGLDVLINNAGIGLPTTTGSGVDEAVRSTIEVNLLGAWRVTAATLPELVRSGGRVVFVASGLAFVPFPFAAAYAVSKRGLSAYADALRIEYGERIRVSTVYPGYVRTPIHRAPESAGVTLEGKVPAERVSDVVRTVLRTLTTTHPPHDTGTTWWGAMLIRGSRCLPTLAEHAVRLRHTRDLDAGRYDDVPIAQAMLQARQSGELRATAEKSVIGR
jgi:NAD(P)-dependent dehydrogenase (short-subunit alcohol dehydrogenase family)